MKLNLSQISGFLKTVTYWKTYYSVAQEILWPKKYCAHSLARTLNPSNSYTDVGHYYDAKDYEEICTLLEGMVLVFNLCEA